MKKFRLKASHYLFIFFAVLTLIIYGCKKEEAPKQLYSGEEMFRAVFFLQGSAADNVDALKSGIDQQKRLILSGEQKAEMNKFVDEIIFQMKRIDPEYFDLFEAQIESKNFYSIDLALKNGNKMIEAAGFKSSYASYFKLAKDIEDKKVNMDDFSNLDLDSEEGIAELKSIFTQKYGINLDEDSYKVSCTVAAGICVAYVVAAAVSSVVAAVTAVGAANLVGYFTVVVKTEAYFWDYNSDESVVSLHDKLVADIASAY